MFGNRSDTSIPLRPYFLNWNGLGISGPGWPWRTMTSPATLPSSGCPPSGLCVGRPFKSPPRGTRRTRSLCVTTDFLCVPRVLRGGALSFFTPLPCVHELVHIQQHVGEIDEGPRPCRIPRDRQLRLARRPRQRNPIREIDLPRRIRRPLRFSRAPRTTARAAARTHR